MAHLVSHFCHLSGRRFRHPGMGFVLTRRSGDLRTAHVFRDGLTTAMEAALLDVAAEVGFGHHRFVETDGHGATHWISHGVMDAELAAQKRLHGGAGAPVQQPTGFEDDFTHWDLLRPLGRSHFWP